MKRLVFTLTLIGLAWNVAAVDPRLSYLRPDGLQPGTEQEIYFRTTRAKDVEDILFYHPGVKVVKINEADDNGFKAIIKAEADCPLGEHKVRLRTRGGLSELRTFYVGPFPTLREVAPKEGEGPQKVALNTTISGAVANESVDRFAVDVKQGQRISVEVECIRLGRYFDDASVAIKNSKGFIVARSDDTPLFIQDCFATTLAKEDDTYTVELRESSYGQLRAYRMHIGTFPRPTAVYPAGGQEGEEVDMKFIDKAAGDFTQTFKAAKPVSFQATFGQQSQPNFRDITAFPEADGVIAPSGNKVRVSPFPNVLEEEPNNSVGEARLSDTPLPVAFNGIIGEPGDQDWFRFTK